MRHKGVEFFFALRGVAHLRGGPGIPRKNELLVMDVAFFYPGQDEEIFVQLPGYGQRYEGCEAAKAS